MDPFNFAIASPSGNLNLSLALCPMNTEKRAHMHVRNKFTPAGFPVKVSLGTAVCMQRSAVIKLPHPQKQSRAIKERLLRGKEEKQRGKKGL
ncbi:hypothetical protein CDAR_196161 [Caerostris darwini]|uniref:Uncharacterized protein n=1 Tax=Caerostris darwini TaxID=1538125 RepID=A0AAV4MGA5_9ARAC|nr:hypothetical protein CDAR_196161 [Caerostris darwini]